MTKAPAPKKRAPSKKKAPSRIARTDYVGRANRYIAGVLDGSIPACAHVIAACQRQKDDLARWSGSKTAGGKRRGLYYFDATEASRVCEFIEHLPHVKGRFPGNLRLEDWQCFILTTVFGWLRSKDGMRRFRTAYLELPRKNAKSTLSAGVALYLLAADAEPGAEVYSAATTREQAAIVFSDARRMIEKAPGLRDALGVKSSLYTISVPRTGSMMKALSREQDGNLDGLNVHGGIIDELHGHKDRGVWDVIETATGARAQPLMWAITTAGFNRAGICYEQRLYVIKLLTRVHQDETYFGIIYTIDEGDDPFADSSWRKANPNYGVSVDPEDLARKASKALQMASAQNNFLTKHLDVWVNADTAWMSMIAWESCGDRSLRIEDFEGADCIIACDLATKIDIAPKVRLFWRDIEGVRHFYAFTRYYLPEDAAEDGRNAHYAGWSTEGRIELTDGAVTDFSVIEEGIREDASRFRVIDACFDPWQASGLMQRLAAEGLPVMEYRQTVQNMSEPMKEWEALVLSGRFHHDGDPVLAWMVSNVVCHRDAKENIYPRKERPENKIDGAVAVIMALGRALTLGEAMDVDDFLNNPVIA
jgi:phage terminase large subunit-like protein